MEEVPSLGSLPLGFRFHPTDEELISHYLKGKNSGRKPKIEVIPEIDVCKCEPWDLPEKSLIRTDDLEWFFFTPRDRKYPNGQRSNRATEAGYWKATGKDRKIRSRGSARVMVIGMKKTLVFHRGRAPKGERTCWIMHEYRVVENDASGDPSENEGAYVLCRLFKKPDETNPQPISSPSVNNICPAIHNGEEFEVLNPNGVNMEELLSTPDEPTASQDVHRHSEGPFKAEDDSNIACDIIGDRGLGFACSLNNNSDVELDTSVFDHLVDLVPQDAHNPFAGLVSTNVNHDYLNCSLLDNGYQKYHFTGGSQEGPICDLASGYGDGSCPLKSDLFSGNDIWPANVVDVAMMLQEENENLPPSANDNSHYFPLSDYYKMETTFEPLVRPICNVVPMSNDSSDLPKSLQGHAKRRLLLEKRVRVPGLLRRINFNSCHLTDRSSRMDNEEQEDNQKRLRRVSSLRKRKDSMPSEIKRGTIKEVLHHSNKQSIEDHDYICSSSIKEAFEPKSNVMFESVVYSTTSDETTASNHSLLSILNDESNSTNTKQDTWHEITTQPIAEDTDSDVKSSVTACVDPKGMLESRRLHVGRTKPCAAIFGRMHTLLIIGALPAVLLVLYVVLSNYFCLLDFFCDGHQFR